ncbi:hypothetical protein GPALN_005465 [Globodera pallida]|nr:hypothetical protein GPALN_005465 [Globodera pallida]
MENDKKWADSWPAGRPVERASTKGGPHHNPPHSLPPPLLLLFSLVGSDRRPRDRRGQICLCLPFASAGLLRSAVSKTSQMSPNEKVPSQNISSLVQQQNDRIIHYEISQGNSLLVLLIELTPMRRKAFGEKKEQKSPAGETQIHP